MKTNATRLPTATQRTLSLFTGKTDLDDTDGRARDGSVPIPRPAPPPAKPRLRWRRECGEWVVGPKDRATHRIMVNGSEYHAFAHGKKLGVFASMILAADACEAA